MLDFQLCVIRIEHVCAALRTDKQFSAASTVMETVLRYLLFKDGQRTTKNIPCVKVTMNNLSYLRIQ